MKPRRRWCNPCPMHCCMHRGVRLVAGGILIKFPSGFDSRHPNKEIRASINGVKANGKPSGLDPENSEFDSRLPDCGRSVAVSISGCDPGGTGSNPVGHPGLS